ncbi:MAG: tetratricopeptide repeat protein [Chloroflexota bacterium]
MDRQFIRIIELFEKQEYIEGEKELIKWLEDHPNHSNGWLLYGKYTNDLSKRQKYFERALELDPDNLEALSLLNELQSKQAPKNQSGYSLEYFDSKNVRNTKNKNFWGAYSKNNVLSFLIYSIFHFTITICGGYIFLVVVGLITPEVIGIKNTKFSNNNSWISSYKYIEGDIEKFVIPINPGNINYYPISKFNELMQYKQNVEEINNNTVSKVDGVKFIAKLLKKNLILDYRRQPVIVELIADFNKIHVPVIYYGPSEIFEYHDKLLISGIYISEINAVIAQRIVKKPLIMPNRLSGDLIVLLRVSIVIFLWGLLCTSVFIWRWSYKKWKEG